MRQLIGLLFLLSAVSVQAGAVKVAPLSALVSAVQYSAPAEVTNYDHSQLSAQISALVQQVSVDVGDRVEQGQLLVQLDCRDHRLALQQAQSVRDALDARIRLARQQLSRAERLLKQRSASQEQRDQRRAELDTLLAERRGSEVQISASQIRVERCQIKAPFAGVITERMAAEGSLANIATPLIRLLRTDRAEVKAKLPLSQVALLQQGRSPLYQTADSSYPLQLRAVIPLINSRSRTQEVRLSFADSKALTGSSGRLVWQGKRPAVPVGMMVKRDGVLGLMLYEEGVSRFRPLPQASEGQAALVDLPQDTLVIVEGQHAVSDGDRVELKDARDL
ncbi:efflux RND transporter periplasmic adaptor subunit [Marinobacterium jannaschii]|uniref:efflux RND transporter periplasmic adaptor subunit n=1 Tax=Marinobacterium jannaschii TaxID=64970 RepID=UPI000AE078FA|nr:efflux RND transporter periplasmic adaptor subunit [Marinobacterium jannaschii]